MTVQTDINVKGMLKASKAGIDLLMKVTEIAERQRANPMIWDVMGGIVSASHMIDHLQADLKELHDALLGEVKP